MFSYCLKYSFFLPNCPLKRNKFKWRIFISFITKGPNVTELFNFPYNPLENLQTKVGKYGKNKSNLLVLTLKLK